MKNIKDKVRDAVWKLVGRPTRDHTWNSVDNQVAWKIDDSLRTSAWSDIYRTVRLHSQFHHAE